jgi:alpha-aminoadipate/glutamate carrier protein LysW
VLRLSTSTKVADDASGPCRTENRQGPLIFISEERTMTSTNCVECGGDVTLVADVIPGEIAPCPDCGAELEVLSCEPLELGLAPAVEEDWGE